MAATVTDSAVKPSRPMKTGQSRFSRAMPGFGFSAASIQEKPHLKELAGSAVAITMLLAGCGSKTDANEKNFGAAIGQYLDQKGELCLDVIEWPLEVNEFDLRQQEFSPASKPKRMAALEAVGLVKGEDVERQGTGYDAGKTFKLKRYTRTDAAKPFERHKEVGLMSRAKETRIDLCWGKQALDKVVKWEGPMKFGDYQEARVKYHYKIEGLADWAKQPQIRAAFPSVGDVIDGVGKSEQTHAVKLSSVGWEPKGLDY